MFSRTVYHKSRKYEETVFSVYAVIVEPLYINLKFIFHIFFHLGDIKTQAKVVRSFFMQFIHYEELPPEKWPSEDYT